jgi:hypothetical protein
MVVLIDVPVLNIFKEPGEGILKCRTAFRQMMPQLKTLFCDDEGYFPLF